MEDLKEFLATKTGIKFISNNGYNDVVDYYEKIFDETYSGDESSAYTSKEIFNNSEFDYQICISVNDGWQVDLKDMNLISVLIAKTKEYQSDDNIISILTSLDMILDDLNSYDICDYGTCANIINLEVSKDDTKETLNYIANCIPVITTLIGFYLDKPMNRIGNTGWDFINGNIGLK